MRGDKDAGGRGKEGVTVGAAEVFATFATEVGGDFVGACDRAAEEDEAGGTEMGQKGKICGEFVAEVEESSSSRGLGGRHVRRGWSGEECARESERVEPKPEMWKEFMFRAMSLGDGTYNNELERFSNALRTHLFSCKVEFLQCSISSFVIYGYCTHRDGIFDVLLT